MAAPTKADLRTVLGLAALVLLLFRPWASGGQPFFGSDLALFFYPLLSAVRDALAAGHFPWWTERVFAGMPLAADPQASVFYPPAWVLFSGPFEPLMAPYLAAHLLLLGSGAALAFSRLGTTRLGAFLGGAALMLGTTVPGRLAAGHLTYLQAAAWIPWAWASLLSHLADGERRHLAAAAGFLGLSLLGGFPQITFYGILWLLWTAISAPRHEGLSATRAGVRTLLTILLAFGVAGAIIVPGWEMSRLSVRTAGMSDAFRLSDSLPLRHLATFFLPGIFGVHPSSYRGGEPYQWWEFTAFNGLLPWLALPLLGRALTRHRAFLHVAAPLPVLLLLALGGNTAVYPLVMRLPGFSLFRIPAQIVFLAGISLAGISALAITALRSSPPRPRGVLAPLGVGIVLLGAWALAFSGGGTDPATAGALLIGSVTCLLFAVGAKFVVAGHHRVGLLLITAVGVGELLAPALPTVSYRPLSRFFPLEGIVSATAPLGEPFRILPLSPADGEAPSVRANEPLRAGCEGITGYNPLLPAGTARLLTVASGGTWPSPGIHFSAPPVVIRPLVDLLNCRVIVAPSPGPLSGEGLRPLPWTTADPRWRFALNEWALGRATVYPALTRVPDRAIDARIRRIDPRSELLVDARLAVPDVATRLPVRSARYEPRHAAGATIIDESGGGGYLLISQTWHPGWRAFWDGGELAVLPADIGLTLVPLPQGCRSVELVYRSASHRAGLALSAASLLALGLVGLHRRRRA